MAVRTDDRDTYQGSNVIVARPPTGPNVSITLFSTGGVYDTRAQAQARLELTSTRGQSGLAILYENHIKGQRVIQIFQRLGTELPAVGKTLTLVGNEGQVNERGQYVRAIRVTGVERSATYDSDEDYKALLVTMELSDARAMTSRDPRPAASSPAWPTVSSCAIRSWPMRAAMSVSYLCKRPWPWVTSPIIAKTIMTQIVPLGTERAPIPAAIPYAAAGLPVSAAEVVGFSTDQAWSTTTSMALPGGCLPGSLSIVVGGVTFIDKAGILMSGTQQVGLVDYANGIVTSSSGSYGDAETITYRPAAYMQRMLIQRIRITPETRSQAI